MPSVLFFLLCVIPSVWIMTLHDVSLKTKLHAETGRHENEIQTFVQSLQITANTEKLLADNIQLQYPEDLLWKNIIPKNYEDITAQTPRAHSPVVNWAHVKVSFWFQEDIWQRVYFQVFLTIISISRWLSTEVSLKITQRMIKLLISLVITVDMLFFFNLALLVSTQSHS